MEQQTATADQHAKGDLFSSMKNQMSGFSNLFGKKEAKEAATEDQSAEQVKSPVKDVAADPPGEEAAAAGAEGEGFGSGLEEVSNKAMQGARSIGSFFASAVSKAGKTVTEAGAKIKKTVEETVHNRFYRSLQQSINRSIYSFFHSLFYPNLTRNKKLLSRAKRAERQPLLRGLVTRKKKPLKRKSSPFQLYVKHTHAQKIHIQLMFYRLETEAI